MEMARQQREKFNADIEENDLEGLLGQKEEDIIF